LKTDNSLQSRVKILLNEQDIVFCGDGIIDLILQYDDVSLTSEGTLRKVITVTE
jgi:hypothetical protein